MRFASTDKALTPEFITDEATLVFPLMASVVSSIAIGAVSVMTLSAPVMIPPSGPTAI